jgi:hypothetical protein
VRSVLRHSATYDGLLTEGRRLKAAMNTGMDRWWKAGHFAVYVYDESDRKKKEDWMRLESFDAVPGSRCGVVIETTYTDRGRSLARQRVEFEVAWMGHENRSGRDTVFHLGRVFGEDGAWVLSDESCEDVRDPAFAAYLGMVVRSLNAFAPVVAPKGADPELLPLLLSAGVRARSDLARRSKA